MTRDKNPGVPGPMTIPMNIPLLGGKGGEKQIKIQDAVQGLLQQVGNLTATIDQLVHANNKMAMDMELMQKRLDALEAKSTLLPDKIEVTVKHEHERDPLPNTR